VTASEKTEDLLLILRQYLPDDLFPLGVGQVTRMPPLGVEVAGPLNSHIWNRTTAPQATTLTRAPGDALRLIRLSWAAAPSRGGKTSYASSTRRERVPTEGLAVPSHIVAVVAGPYARAMGRVSGLVDRVGILRPLRVRDFAFLWIGLTVSFIGDGIYIIAIAWQTYDLSNSPSALAAVGIA
jgi:hypothetical protein